MTKKVTRERDHLRSKCGLLLAGLYYIYACIEGFLICYLIDLAVGASPPGFPKLVPTSPHPQTPIRFSRHYGHIVLASHGPPPKFGEVYDYVQPNIPIPIPTHAKPE